MGELRTRKRGKTWEYSFEGAKVDGKRKPISKGGFRTKAEAIAAGTQAKAEYDNAGCVFTPATVSVADYLDYWIDTYVKTNLSYNTIQNYSRLVRKHLKPALGAYRLSALKAETIQKWIDQKKLHGYAKSMVKDMLSCLSTALDYAVTPCQYIKVNQCKLVRLPKIQDKKEAIEHKEYICVRADYEQILERFPECSNFYLPIITGYHLGTRLGETYAFDLLRDVDFENHKITIQHQLANENGTWFYRPPKYDSVRTILIDEIYENALKNEILKREKSMQKYGKYFTKSYILPDHSLLQARADIKMPYREIMPISARENGEILTPNSFKYAARVIHEELGNANFHSHCLRHTHGTILAENGAQPKTVMERLGHKDITTTMNRYVFNTDKMQQNAVEIFMRAIS